MDEDVAFEVHVDEGGDGVVHFVEGDGFLGVGVVVDGVGGEGGGGVDDGEVGGGEHVV